MSVSQQQSWAKERQFYYTTFGSMIAALSWWNVLKLQNDIRKINKQIRQYEKIPNYTVGQSISVLNQNPQNQQPQLFFVEGTPRERNLISQRKDQAGQYVPLISKIQFRQSLYTNAAFNDTFQTFDWKNVYNSINYSIEKLPNIHLADTQGVINVKLPEDCDMTQALSYIGYQDIKRRLTFGELIAHWAVLFYSSLVRIIGLGTFTQAFTRAIGFKGIHLGYRDNEFGVRANGVLSVLGSVLYDADKREFRIERPLLIATSKRDYLNYLQKKIETLQNTQAPWLIIGGLATLYVLRRAYRYYSINKKDIHSFINRLLGKDDRKIGSRPPFVQ